MQKPKRQTLPAALQQEWSTAIQFHFAQALPLVTSWTCTDVAFHGGTSLNMSWGSPRFSEDLDFLLSEEKVSELREVMNKALKRMQASMMLAHPGVELSLTEKTRPGSNLEHFQVQASHPNYLGRAMVKVEFWKVDRDYLANYESEFVFPVRQGDVVTRSSSPLPAATLAAAYADKLTAFATRPHLKWRDIFDTWWIDGQVKASISELAARFVANVSAYPTYDSLSPAQALRSFLERHNREEVIGLADPDLKRWLPPRLWDSLWPYGVPQMVDTVFSRLEQVAGHLEQEEATDESRHALRCRP